MSRHRDWSAVDWSMRNVDISRLRGVTPQAVYQARMRHAPATVRWTKARWLAMDWSKTDASIAQIIGVAKGTVWAARRRYAPETLKGVGLRSFLREEFAKAMGGEL